MKFKWKVQLSATQTVDYRLDTTIEAETEEEAEQLAWDMLSEDSSDVFRYGGEYEVYSRFFDVVPNPCPNPKCHNGMVKCPHSEVLSDGTCLKCGSSSAEEDYIHCPTCDGEGEIIP